MNKSYTTNIAGVPSKVVVPNQTTDQQYWHKWLKQNGSTEIMDKDGLLWTIEIKENLLPDKASESAMIWILKLKVTSRVTVEDLLKTRVLESKNDSRLIQLIGESFLVFSLKPLEFSSSKRENLKTWLYERIAELKLQLENNDLYSIKRSLVGKWVEQRCLFGTI